MFRITMMAVLWLAVLARLAAAEPPRRMVAELMAAEAKQTVLFGVSSDRRKVFVLVDRQSEAQHATSLRSYDVSDPHAPMLLTEILLGNFEPEQMIVAGARIFIKAAIRGVYKSAIYVFDVNDIYAPKQMVRMDAHVYAHVDTAADGSCFVAMTYAQSNSQEVEKAGFRFDAKGDVQPSPCATSGLHPIDDWHKDSHDRFDGWTSERRQHRVPFIRRPTQAGATEEYSLTDPPFEISGALFLHEPRFVVASTNHTPRPGTTGSILILDASKQAFDADRVRSADAAIQQQHDSDIVRVKPRLGSDYYETYALDLWAAGVLDALALPNDEIRRAGLLGPILDWATWQSFSPDPLPAIPVLQRLLDIDPDRVSPVLRILGNAVRAGLNGAVSRSERIRLTRIALDADNRLKKLTRVASPDAIAFAKLNVLMEPSGICQRIAAYQSQDRLHEISVGDGVFDPRGDGKPVKLDVRYGGSLLEAGVHAEDTDGQNVEHPFGDRPGGYHTNILFIPFDGAVYALPVFEGKISTLWDWQGRAACQFGMAGKLSITESHDKPACQALVKHPFSPAYSPPAPVPDDQPVNLLESGTWLSQLTWLEAEEPVWANFLGRGKPDQATVFSGHRSHGGCSVSGVVLLENGRLQNTLRNHALLAVEKELQDCADARASIVRHNGRDYIEFDTEQMSAGNMVAKRTLLRVTKTGAETVCRIGERLTYFVKHTGQNVTK